MTEKENDATTIEVGSGTEKRYECRNCFQGEHNPCALTIIEQGDDSAPEFCLYMRNHPPKWEQKK